MFRWILTAIALIWTTTGFALEVERVDPPSWWTGFERESLQLMIYGSGFSEATQATVEGTGITVDKTVFTGNPDYLFLYLTIASSAVAQEITIRLTSEGNDVAFPYQLSQKQTAVPRGFSGKDVIYLITPDRFANGDPGNDRSIDNDLLDRRKPGARHGGDLRGVIDNLGYIHDMGFTAIWLNPVLENRAADHSYHGYAITDLYRIDPRFGSNEEYLELVQEARRLGMGIIKDVVLNHIGVAHPWVTSLPESGWFNTDASTYTNHAHTTVQDPYSTPTDRAGFVDGWFVDSMPDLNQRNTHLAQYLIQHSLWWIEHAGLAGFRVDTYSYSDAGFLHDWSKAVLTEYPDFTMVGEEWHNSPAIVSYWQKGKVNHDGYVSHLPVLMDFPLQRSLVKVLKSDPPTWGGVWNPVYELLGQDFLYADPTNLVIFADNHDMSRVAAELEGDESLIRMAMMFIATMRGIPQIYYGTEILMANRTGDHGVIREDFPGGWSSDRTNAFTGTRLKKKPLRMQQFVRQLLNWRKGKPVLHDGAFMHLVPTKDLYAYFRFDVTDAVMVFLNRGASIEVSADRLQPMLTRYGNEWRSVLTGEPVQIGDALLIPENDGLLLEPVPRDAN